MFSAPVVWLKPSREAWHRHHSNAQVSCKAQHSRRDALEAAVQADPGLRNRAARMEGGTAGDADLRSRGLWYGWDQNSLVVTT